MTDRKESPAIPAAPAAASPAPAATPSAAAPAAAPAAKARVPEQGGPRGLEPTRYGDWERDGRCVDF
ncbi:MAG: hypothetical protein RLZZ276_1858 [Pseudomonadota bacterium]|jgi:hypothetical protein